MDCETKPTETDMTSEVNATNSNLATVQRLNSYPVINFAVNQVSSVYQSTKVKSDMLKGGLDRIESSLTKFMTTALHPFQQHSKLWLNRIFVNDKQKSLSRLKYAGRRLPTSIVEYYFVHFL